MTREKGKNTAASIRARLLAIAQSKREDYQRVLSRYAIERFLYRLGRSPYRDKFALKGATLSATEGDWVFPSPRTAKPYDSGSLRKKVLKAAALRAKIQARIGWHTFRHSYRAWLDETGAFLGVQQKLMRHANISTTMNVYGGAFMESKRKANTSVVQRVLLQDHTK